MRARSHVTDCDSWDNGQCTTSVPLGVGTSILTVVGDASTVGPGADSCRKLLGAKVIPVTSGSRTLKDAMNEAMRDWVTNIDDTFYIIGTVAGPVH